MKENPLLSVAFLAYPTYPGLAKGPRRPQIVEDFCILMKLINHALQWHNLGIAVIPIHYRSKRPVFSWKQYQETIPNTDEIKSWFRSKFLNLGVVTGHRGLCIIDFDDLPTFNLWRSWINIYNPTIQQTYRVRTRRGEHIYLFVDNPPERTINIKSGDKTLIDIKANGYCLAPPSIHPTGHKYQSINQLSDIKTVESLECVIPKNLLDEAQKEVKIPKVINNNYLDPFKATPVTHNNPIQWIKRNRSIIEFFPDAKKTKDGWYVTICPFHSDHEESGWINIHTNRFGCRTGCVGRGVDIIDFYALLKGIDRRQSIWELSR